MQGVEWCGGLRGFRRNERTMHGGAVAQSFKALMRLCNITRPYIERN